MLIRGLAGIIIGVAYGFLVGLVVSLLTSTGLEDRPNAGLILLDARAMAWFATMLSGITAAACAAFVGLIVGAAGVGMRKAAIFGFVTGLLPIVLVSLAMWSFPTSVRDFIELLVMIALLPVGVALTGILVSIVAEKLKQVLL